MAAYETDAAYIESTRVMDEAAASATYPKGNDGSMLQNLRNHLAAIIDGPGRDAAGNILPAYRGAIQSYAEAVKQILQPPSGTSTATTQTGTTTTNTTTTPTATQDGGGLLDGVKDFWNGLGTVGKIGVGLGAAYLVSQAVGFDGGGKRRR